MTIIDKDKILCKTLSKKLKFKKVSDGKMRAVFNKTTLWNNKSELEICFINNYEDWRRAWVAYIITNNMQPYIGIKLKFNLDNVPDPEKYDIRIDFNSTKGSYSLIGTDAQYTSNPETMNLGWIDAPSDFTFIYNDKEYYIPEDATNLTGGGNKIGGTILHEFGHALGMIHEHQSPFNNPFIWNVDTIYKEYSGPPNSWSIQDIKDNFLNNYGDQVELYNGSSFDPYSIMKYAMGSSTELLDKSKYPSKDKYEIAVGMLEQLNTKLSDIDKYWLGRNYPGGKYIVPEPPNIINYDAFLQKKMSKKEIIIIGVIAIFIVIIIIFIISKFN
jgi:hypothetical protein